MLDTPITTAETRESAAEYLSPAEQIADGILSELNERWRDHHHQSPFMSASASEIDMDGMHWALGPTVDPPDLKRETFTALSTPQTLAEAAEAFQMVQESGIDRPASARSMW